MCGKVICASVASECEIAHLEGSLCRTVNRVMGDRAIIIATVSRSLVLHLSVKNDQAESTDQKCMIDVEHS